MNIDYIVTKNGDCIYFMVDTVNNKPWYRIVQQNKFSSSSYYDGDDVERAKEIYGELLLAFKGLQAYEDFNKSNINTLYNVTTQLNQSLPEISQELKMQPLFLGVNDF